MITMTCRFTFCESWDASAGVIGAVATFSAAGAAATAPATTACPIISAGTDAAAMTREKALLLARARGAPPVMRPCMLASSRRRPRAAAR